MGPVWSRLGLAFAGLGIGSVLLALSLHGTSARAVLAVLAAGDWGWPALVALGGTAAFVAAKVVRWHVLLGTPRDIGIVALGRPVLAGLALNSLVPHSGELLRAMAVQRRHGRATFAVLSSIFVERLFDLFAVLVLGAGALVIAPARGAEFAAALRIVAAVAAAGAALVLAALLAPAVVRRAVLACVRPLPEFVRRHVAPLTDELIEGMRPVRRVATALAVLCWSLAQWLAIALCVYGCAAVAGFAVSLPTALLVVVGIVVTFLLPNAPGYVGATQAAFTVVLAPLGIAADRALAASVAYQLLMILPLAVVGLACVRGALRPVTAP